MRRSDRCKVVLVMATTLVSHAARADLVASTTVDTTRDRGAVVRDVLGADIEYSGQAAPDLIDPLVAGTPIARFPGGDDTSGFLWTDGSAGSCTTARFDWDAFATMARRLGVGVLLETNALRGTPESNAAWVLDARARGLRVPWVEIGNEVWGSWDAGFRTPAQYANDVRASAAAIRARTPDVGIVLEIGTRNEDAWNRAAVAATADVIDAVDYHYYPNHLSPADAREVAAGADGIAPLLARIRAMLHEVAPARADAIRIVFGEWDGASDPPRPGPPVAGVAYCQWSMANALFYGVAVGEMLEGGVAAAMFYELQGYRFGAIGGDACTRADTTVRRPKELVMRLWREHVGDRRVAVAPGGDMPTFHSDGPTDHDGFAGDAPLVRTYASLGDGGATLRLMIVNRSPTATVNVGYDLVGFAHDARAERTVLTGDSIDATNENVGGPTDAVHLVTATLAIASDGLRYAAPPHSITALTLHRATATRPDAARGCRAERAGATRSWMPWLAIAVATGLARRVRRRT